ncbi:MAG: YihY/virulence factor BrkB family protein [Nitrospiraceae bacterium]
MGQRRTDPTETARQSSYSPSPVRLSLRNPRTFWTLIKKTISKWNDDPVLRFGAALAYYTAFSVVPLVVVVLEIATLIVGHNAEVHLLKQIEEIIGEQSAEALGHLLDNWQRAGSTGLALGVAVATLFFAAAGAFDQLQDALNAIWGVEPKSQDGVLVRARRRFLSILGLLGTAFLLLVSLAASAGLAAFGQVFSASVPGPDFVGKTISSLMSFAVITLLFAMIFKLLPKAKVAWSDVWTGAFVTAVLFTIGKLLIVLYLGRSDIVSLYGAAGSLVMIMLWAYYSSQILLFGAEFTAVYASDCGSHIVPTQDAVAVGEPAKTDEHLEQSEGNPRASR